MAVEIPPQLLISHGCVNCIWKSHGQCPTPDTRQPSGICADYHKFLLSFAEKGDSVSSLFEKFNLYLVELQSLRDYNRFMEVSKELEELRKTCKDEDKLNALEARITTHKLWWARLSKLTLDAYSKVVDRDVKSGKNIGDDRMSIQQLENFMNRHIKELDDMEAKMIEDKTGEKK